MARRYGARIRRRTLAGIAVWILAGGCRPGEPAKPVERPAAGIPETAAPDVTHFGRADLDEERELTPEESHLYRLDLIAGHFLHVEVEQRGTDVFVQLLDGAARTLITVDSHTGDQDAEHLVVVTETSGPHALVVQAFGGKDNAGAYLARIAEERPADSRDRRHAEAEKSFAAAYALVEDSPPQTVPEAAVAGYESAAAVWEELGNTVRQAQALFELATLYRDAGRKREAIVYYRRSLTLWTEPTKSRAVVFNDLAGSLLAVGDPSAARRHYEEALTLFRELKDSRNEASVLNNLGRLESRQGRALQALKLLRRAEELWREVGDRQELVKTLNVSGEVYEKLGETELALDHHRQALALLDPQTDSHLRATTLSFMGRAFLEAGDLDEAEAAYRETLTLRQRGNASAAAKARAWNGLGLVAARRGDARRALELYQRALAVFQDQETLMDRANVLNNLAWTYSRLGEADQALELHRQALELYRRLTEREGEAISHLGLAFAYRLLGRLQNALESSERALTEIERVLESGQTPAVRPDLQLPYLSSLQRYFELHVDLLMERHRQRPDAGYDALALATSEQARARHLLEVLAVDPKSTRQAFEPGQLERLRVLREEINAADHEIRRRLETNPEERLEEAQRRQRLRLRDYYQLTQRIQERSPWHASLHPPRPLALEGIQRLLDPDTLLLEFHLGEQHSFLWTVDSTGLQSDELPPRREVERLARRAYEMLVRSDRITHRAPAEHALAELSAVLLGSLADRLAGQRLLIVVSGSALEYVPFAALPLPGASRGKLLEEHEILYVPSASVLAALRGRKPDPAARQGLLAVFADPVFDAGDERLAGRIAGPTSFDPGLPSLHRLPYSRREAETILSLAGGKGPVLAALGFEARRDLALDDRLADYRILHFATHGVLHAEHPELSALVLSRYDAEGRPVEGRLSLDEIHDLHLPADLVVLSACRTALGKEIRGEGLMGLPRGFLYAGAARVLASLWSVEDESTAELMAQFYRHLLLEGQSPAEALRNAQLSMMAETRYAPYHWAGFVLQGDWR